MRYVVLIALGLLSVLISGSFAQVLEVAGIQIDIILLITVSMALTDRTTTPIVFGALSGLLSDACYSTVVGCTALAYTVTAAGVYFVVQRVDRINLFMVVVAGAAAYLLKNAIIALVLIAQDIPGVGTGILLRYILPGAALTAILIIPAYWLVSRLERARFMRPRRVMLDEF